LLKHIETPGLEIKSLLARVTKDVVEETKGMQRPWQNSSLEGDFYFLPPPVVAAVSSVQSLVTLDSMFWDSIKTSQNPADFKAYLARFPKGVFVDLAQNRLATLQHDIMPNVGPANTPQVPPPPSVQPQQLASPGSSPPTTSLRDRGQTDGLIGRARALIGVGDIISARIALRHAYELGDARAALELGGTYDPVMLKRLNVTLGNSYADAVQAHDWYVRAAELGSIDAIHRMKQLSLENR